MNLLRLFVPLAPEIAQPIILINSILAKDTALLIVDMQNGVFDGSIVPPVARAEQLLEGVAKLIEKARESATCTIFVQHNGGKGHPMETGTKGWDIHPDLAVDPRDPIVQKDTPDSFYETHLQDELTARNIKKLVIAGIQTEFCIDTTCRQAFSLNYDVLLAEDAHSTWDTERFSASQIIDHHNHLLGEWFVSLRRVNDLSFEKSP